MELTNAINWFKIPVSNFERAKKFYETIFSYLMPENQMDQLRIGFFLCDLKSGKGWRSHCLQSSIIYPM